MSSESTVYDFAIIGSGIAGASMAYELSMRGASVLLLEAEEYPAYHTTGRSAAFYMAGYGNDVVRAFTLAGGEFYDGPPKGFCEYPLLKDFGAMYIANANQHDKLQKVYDAVSSQMDTVSLIDRHAMLKKVPLLKENYTQAYWEPDSTEIDVASLMQGYLKGAKRTESKTSGTKNVCNSRVENLKQCHGLWEIKTSSKDATTYQAETVINAAGAWADQVAEMAGAKTVGLIPKKRTVCIVTPPKDIDVSRWPLTIDIDEQFYFKPDGGNLLLTPADETPMPPMDAFPLDEDVALGIARMQEALDFEVTHVLRQWAGLRTFAEDRSPVMGFDSTVKNFFWLAGQGGYGIQMAPGLSQTAAQLIMDGQWSQMISKQGVGVDDVSPGRYQD